jgi:outer membrane protein assembly factor BamC
MSVHSRLIRGFCLVVAGVVLLSGCSTTVLQNRKVDYKAQAQKLPPLEVPPDLTPVQPDERYSIPGGGKAGTTYSQYSKDRTTGPAEGSTGVLPKLGDSVHIEHDGAQRWLVVNATPEQVWPILKDFWTSSGFTLKVDDPKLGIMETDWNENRANIPQDIIRRTLGKVFDFLYSTSLRDKYRTRIERGSVQGTTEIYITHKGMEEVMTKDLASTIWQPRPSDPELENEFLKRLALRFGVDSSKAATLTAEAAPAAKPMPLTAVTKNADGDTVLQLAEPFDRAWRRVGLALDRGGFTVEDRDRSAGVYYVRYTDPANAESAKKEGWLSKLQFWKSEDKALETQTFRLYVFSPSSGKGTEVNVRDKAEKPINPETASRIINLLYDQLR